MNKSHLLAAVCASALTFSLPNSAVAASAFIDDFNVDTTSTVTDTTVGGPVTGPSTIDVTNSIMNGAAGWTRTLTADLTDGDRMDTVVCGGCQAGHVTMGGGSSNGVGTYTYSGPAIELWWVDAFKFDWGADLAGARVDIIASDGNNTSTVASWSSLPATGGSAPEDLVTQMVIGPTWGAVNSRAITEMQFVVTGVRNMDSIIDNIKMLVPIPATVWLFGSGLIGFIGVARRKKA